MYRGMPCDVLQESGLPGATKPIARYCVTTRRAEEPFHGFGVDVLNHSSKVVEPIDGFGPGVSD
jgi:hypothetical protein